MLQNFSDSSTVEPFENRETHLSTKFIPPENLVKVSTSPKSELLTTPDRTSSSTITSDIVPSDDLSFETPPRTLPPVVHPPPLTGGREFLPFSSSSDDDSSNDGQPIPKRIKSSPPADDESAQNVYSELHYLEATGSVRTGNEPKHRGTRTTHHVAREGSPAPQGPTESPSSSHTPRRSDDYQAKRTMLKISYRIHLHTGEIQFALIVYENISTRSATVRRNLFSAEPQLQSPTSSGTPVHHAFSPSRQGTDGSPQPTPLPLTPPEAEEASLNETLIRTGVEPPGTPIKRRRISPVIAGTRIASRRSRSIEDFAAEVSHSSSSFNLVQQTWPRKSETTAGGGGNTHPDGRSRKFSACPSSIRKPLRF